MKRILPVLAVLALTFSGCQEQGPAERAGEKLDEASEGIKGGIEDAGDAVKDAVDDTGDALKEAGEDVKEGVEEAGEEIKDAADPDSVQ
jgi:hypothetical protein